VGRAVLNGASAIRRGKKPQQVSGKGGEALDLLDLVGEDAAHGPAETPRAKRADLTAVEFDGPSLGGEVRVNPRQRLAYPLGLLVGFRDQPTASGKDACPERRRALERRVTVSRTILWRPAREVN
jgi:hypothetical protein